MNLVANCKYTIIDFSDFDGSTRKREIRIKCATGSMISYHRKGSRGKAYHMNLDSHQMIFEGWGLPIKVDTETSRFRTDRHYVFISTFGGQAAIRAFIAHNNLNSYFTGWHRILVEMPERQLQATNLFSKI